MADSKLEAGSPNPPESDSLIEALTNEIVLPPVVQKSVWKAIGSLISATVDVPVAWLQDKAQAIRDITSARSLVATRISKVAADEVVKQTDQMVRAGNYLGNRILREQKNREEILGLAVQEINRDPPKLEPPDEVSDDWLALFSRLAETRSDKDVQQYLARLLAGEIRRPGSFSPATMEVLAKLTKRQAQLFHIFCNNTAFKPGDSPSLIAEPFGHPGVNSLSPFGLPYIVLCELQEAGLVRHDLGAWKGFTGEYFLPPFEIGGEAIEFVGPPNDSAVLPEHRKKVNCISMTGPGAELRALVLMVANPEFVTKTVEWVCSKYGLTIKR